MELELLTPLESARFDGVEGVTAGGFDGPFTVLPRHADYAAAIRPSILSFRVNGHEVFFGVDEGVLTKSGPRVVVSVRQAVKGSSLSDLKAQLAEERKSITNEERKARSALASLEGGLAKLMVELRKNDG
jgi:F-type H+-transporting ATPase subunit epsilon